LISVRWYVSESIVENCNEKNETLQKTNKDVNTQVYHISYMQDIFQNESMHILYKKNVISFRILFILYFIKKSKQYALFHDKNKYNFIIATDVMRMT